MPYQTRTMIRRFPLRGGIEVSLGCERELFLRELKFVESRIDLEENWPEAASVLAGVALDHLPSQVLLDLASLNDINGPAYVLLSGVCDDDTSDRTADLALIAIVEAADLRVHTLLEQYEGALVQPITPRRGDEQKQSSSGTVAFGFHTDDPILHPSFRVEHIHLLCRENSSGSGTVIVSARHLLDHLTDEAVRILTEPRFFLPAPESFSLPGGRLFSEPRPILSLAATDVHVTCELNAVEVERGDTEALRGLLGLRHAAQLAAHHRIVLQQHQLLSLSNLRSLHAREAITGPRHLRRVYSKRSLESLRQATTQGSSAVRFSAATLIAASESLAQSA